MFQTECKTVIKQGKRRLEYINHARKTRLPIKVGTHGGLSVKSRRSKTRRYVSSTCRERAIDKLFWATVKTMGKSNVTRKR